MPKYELTTTQRFVIETEDIRLVLRNMSYADFPEGLIGEAEFLDGTDTWEVIE